MAYFARGGVVFVSDGPWEAKLTEAQTDQLLDLWNEADAVSLFNSLFDACKAAGYMDSGFSRRPVLRLVPRPARQAIVADMLRASLAEIEPEPPTPAA